LNGAVAVAEAVLLGKVGGKLSQSVKSEVKTTEKVAEVNLKKGEPVTIEPEANFAGQVSVRPRDGLTPPGTSQIDTPLGKHLISGEVAGRKNQKVISGGHNSDNFYEVLNSNGGKVISNPTQVSKGIMDIKYQLPNGRVETKTVYDPKVYTDKQMAAMANEAASKAIVNYGVNGNKIQHVIVNGITFRVPISSYKGTNYVPSAFPINPISGGAK
jgi:filamentous hemagglutinin